jgi:hypothetical protein
MYTGQKSSDENLQRNRGVAIFAAALLVIFALVIGCCAYALESSRPQGSRPPAAEGRP